MWFDGGLRLVGKSIGPRQETEFRSPAPGCCCMVTDGTRLQPLGIGRKLPCKARRKRMRRKLA